MYKTTMLKGATTKGPKSSEDIPRQVSHRRQRPVRAVDVQHRPRGMPRGGAEVRPVRGRARPRAAV